MAAAVVGGAFLSASLNVLFDRLASREVINFFSEQKFDDALVDKLKITLMALGAVLDDAENQQISNKHVKDWLEELQHVVYQADDLLDEIATKALRNKLEADDQPCKVGLSRFFHLMKQFLLRINCFVSTPALLSDKAIESRMKEVISNLDRFVNQKNSLNLVENVGRQQWQRQETSSVVVESDVKGRDNDREKIIKLLLSDDANRNHIHVVPIVGMGGMGKTTLAQLVYNDARVNEKFQPLKAWVCVSDPFDTHMITKKIFDDLTASNTDIKSLNQLQIKLKETLTGKKFLIVLDDVWNHNYNDWDCLRIPFSVGAPESRIIITTRIDEVALRMGTVPSHHLEQLLFEDCWSLFAKHAFGSGDYVAHSNVLESIGKQIVEKCKGLPLAIKSLGGLLRSNQNIEDWKNILKSEIWDLNERNILPALRLSYQYLPSHLKRCFAYCSIFPKDYIFEKEKLIQFWIAVDLVQQPNILLEDVGKDYFRELLSMSFFQKLSHDTDSDFIMHDLMHDLAQQISGEFCFRLEDGKPLNHIGEKVRHFSYVQGEYDAFEKFKAVNEKCLRTFIPFSRDEYVHYFGNKVLHDMLPTLRCLRVLSLSRYVISELPQSIENLILLRYLDLSRTKIRRLPHSVTTLCNLQTLDLSYCTNLIELPVNMRKLIKLRHLDIRGTRLTEMPKQLNRLKDLQHLTYFVVGKDDGSRISELKELCQLRGQLCISELQNITSGPHASEANLKGKEQLEGLGLKWGSEIEDLQKENDVLDKLQPHAGVKHVRIINYGGTRFPDWLERAHSFLDMVSLDLINCANCSCLPSIGQLPSLKYVRIEGMKAIKKVGEEFYGNASSLSKPFQSLKTLSFRRMSEWEEWHTLGAGEFSQLLELSMVDCPKLISDLSIRFPSLRKLEISENHGLVSNQVGLLLQGLPYVQELKISAMTKLTELPQQLQHLSSLETLEISQMPNLTELPQQLQHLSSSLQKLEIKDCPSLVSIPEVGLPPMLKTLEVRRCEALQSLAAASSSVIEELRITFCSSLVQMSLPIATLKILDISGCRRLEFPLVSLSAEKEHNYHTSIEELSIKESCDLLKSLWLGFFPKLRSLDISECINLETLLIPNEELQNLTILEIEKCPKMVSFGHGDGGGLLLAPNLTNLSINDCKNLKSLPQRMHTLLPSLQELVIEDCPEVESFPDGGLPSNLRRLTISDCEKLMKGRKRWGLQQTLFSLEDFSIKGKSEEQVLESFPEEWLLPTTLARLWLWELPNLKSLNHKALQHLTSLTDLKIWVCPMLQSLPEEGLPNSLTYLETWACPLLKRRCQREKGEDWPKISAIRHICIDHEDILNFE